MLTEDLWMAGEIILGGEICLRLMGHTNQIYTGVRVAFIHVHPRTDEWDDCFPASLCMYLHTTQ
jgi:hypothetical protein